MDELSLKIMNAFPGRVVRKDLTELMKNGANVPTYVLEYLLGMYCSTDDEAAISMGMAKIRKILSENYARPEMSEFIKSRIRENKEYTVIDKIYVEYDEYDDIYRANFTNLEISPFKISSDMVVNNSKILIGGIWCIARIAFVPKNTNDEDDDDLFSLYGNRKKKKKVKKYYQRNESPFEITMLKPIQMPNLDIEGFISNRSLFSKDEWMDLILRSAGYEPDGMTKKLKFHYLSRMLPLVQKNYNLVELGPRGTGKSHIYSEISPYSILMSGGNTTASNLFYNLRSRSVGLVGQWDCIAFDEVGGMTSTSTDTFQIMKNYLANGSFARGTESINADASICFEGNINKSVEDILKTSHLFETFPQIINMDAAFFDRIHYYLPGWEIPKLKSSFFTKKYGLITDCISEFFHQIRKIDFTGLFDEYFELNDCFNTRDERAVRLTFSGLAKILYPNGIIDKEGAEELLQYSIEGRRRVKEQLRRIAPIEFRNVSLGYVDIETKKEYVVVPSEQSTQTLVYRGFEDPGYVYAIGKSIRGVVGVYHLENRIFSGAGELKNKNIEGVPISAKSVRDSINAAFTEFLKSESSITNVNPYLYDYALFFNDLQERGVSDDISVAEVVGLYSALIHRPVKPGLVIVGRVVVSGSMMPVSVSLMDILTTAISAGAKSILLPIDCKEKMGQIPADTATQIDVIYYTHPLDAANKALGVD